MTGERPSVSWPVTSKSANGDSFRCNLTGQLTLQYLLGQQKKVKLEVERADEQLDDRQAQLIDSIPGVGRLTTAATLVVVRDASPSAQRKMS